MSKAVIFFADGTEECEALIVADLLRRAHVEVITASVTGQRRIVSSHKVPLETDALAEEIDFDTVDLAVLPGGMPGTLNLEASPVVLRVAKQFAADPAKKLAAICAAPSILGHLGLLQGKRATSHAGFRDQLTGAAVLDQEVVIDGNLITSFGLGGAIPFGLELVRQLAGAEAEAHVRDAIEYLHA